MEGYRQALAHGRHTRRSVADLPVYAVAARWLSIRATDAARAKPTALFCYNDLIAVGAMIAARHLNIEIPSELADCWIWMTLRLLRWSIPR